MTLTPIPFGKQAYQSRALPLSVQRCVNLFPEVQPEDAKERIILHGSPGLSTFATLTGGPVRGLHVFGGTLYAVIGPTFASVSSVGVVTSIGTVSGSDRVSMADNGTQIVIVNGVTGYTYTAAGGLAQITSVNFFPASTVAYSDGYFIFERLETGSWFISGLLDGTAYDSTDYSTTSADPDNAIAVLADHGEIWVFGERSIEGYWNSGAADFPFTRISGGRIERGCGAKFSTAKLDNSVYWLGDDFVVYKANGYQPQRISTHAIEYAISQYSTKDDAFAYTYTEEGHAFYVLTFPTGNATWVHDASTGLWHERMFRDPNDNSENRHRSNCYAYCYGKHLVGDYSTGTVWQMSLDTYADGSWPIKRIATSPVLHAQGNRAFMSMLDIDIETGVGLNSGQGSDPQLMLRASDDGGRTWSSERWASIGAMGDYRQRARWSRMGSFYNRVIEVSITDPVKVAILGARAEIS